MSSRSRNQGIRLDSRVRLTHADARIDTTLEGKVANYDSRYEMLTLVGMSDEFYVGDGGWRVEVIS